MQGTIAVVAVLLLLAAGAVEDLRDHRISPWLNRLLLVGIALAAITLPFRSEPAAVTAVRLLMSVAYTLLFSFYVLGGADAKFLILTALALPYSTPYQPLQLFLITVIVWAIIPTRAGLRMLLNLWLLAPLALLALIDLYTAAFAIAFCLAYARYLESSFMREKFPFLHALLIAVVLHLATPVLTGMGMWSF